MSDVAIDRENANLMQIVQRSQGEVESIERRLNELKVRLQEKKREIPTLQQELSECKKVCQNVEEEASLEIERLIPKRYVFVLSDELVKVDSEFAATFLRSCKHSDKSFRTLELPKSIADDYSISNGPEGGATGCVPIFCFLLCSRQILA